MNEVTYWLHMQFYFWLGSLLALVGTVIVIATCEGVYQVAQWVDRRRSRRE